MAVVEFRIREFSDTSGREYVLLEFTLSRPMKPEDLKSLELPKIPYGRILLISGKGPVWLYGVLLHEYLHVSRAVAFYDPRISGYVVVATHTPDVEVGDVIIL